MGQELSSFVDEDTPTRTLNERSVEAVASYVKGGRAKKIVVMTGAGISTSAGIPDFRSPDTGLYANLAKSDLPYAEAVFERAAGVPSDKIVEAHGSFATQRCIECRTPYPDNLMREAVKEREVPHCSESQCNGLVKPDIVFFGEALPENFHRNKTVPCEADLVIVMGTSLTVQPFASLPELCDQEVPRVLLNREHVGSLGCRADDVLILDDCDAGVRKLASALGWLDQLQALSRIEDFDELAPAQELDQPKDKTFDDEITRITNEVQKSLNIAEDHCDNTRSFLETDKKD
ncbi:MAG: hypothetical protein LQ342_001529 [Letrouitia transgressa]|nr:MAG: hypothetical protein LQ342_001529 [Letrouitia transgressa]